MSAAVNRAIRGSPHDLLLVLWIVLLGADRVSLLDKLVPFVFTPFLALTPLVIVSEWLRHRLRGRHVTVPRAAVEYASVAAALIAVVWASVSISLDPSTSAARASLLLAEIVGTGAVVVLASGRQEFERLLARAAVIGIAVFVIADVVQVAALFRVVPEVVRVGPAAIALETVPYAGVIPRLSALVGDPNRTGWVVLFMAFLVAIGERRTSVRRVAIAAAAVLIAFTLSRSTLLAASVTLLVLAATQRPLRVRVAPVVAGCLLAAALASALFIAPPARAPRMDPLAPLAERFSSTEGSASEHVLLLRRGLDEATASPSRLLLGMGYGTSYLVVQDRFPGNRYGNFHSLYVSLFAESGLFALLLILALLGWPLLRGGRYRPLIAGAAMFNLFYQTSTEPAFWCLLALAWVAGGVEVSEARAPTARRSG